MLMEPNNTAPQATKPDAQSTASPAFDVSTLLDQIAEKIIERQEAIIGPVAVERAQQVKGLKIDWTKHDVDITGDSNAAIDALVEQYKELFGQLAVETCKEAVGRDLAQLPPDKVPSTLK